MITTMEDDTRAAVSAGNGAGVEGADTGHLCGDAADSYSAAVDG